MTILRDDIQGKCVPDFSDSQELVSDSQMIISDNQTCFENLRIESDRMVTAICLPSVGAANFTGASNENRSKYIYRIPRGISKSLCHIKTKHWTEHNFAILSSVSTTAVALIHYSYEWKSFRHSGDIHNIILSLSKSMSLEGDPLEILLQNNA